MLKARARTAVGRIAGDDAVEEAAWSVHRALVEVAASEVAGILARGGVAGGDSVLFAFGGGGGLYGAEVARACGIPRVYSFAHSSVFSAFGISGMDVSHVYELPISGDVAGALRAARARALVDAVGEGLDPEGLRFHLEVDGSTGAGVIALDGDWSGAVQALGGALGARLRATAPAPPAPVANGTTSPTAGEPARKGERTIHRPQGPLSAAVYDRDRLGPGATISGPALVEAVDTTIVVPPGARLRIDEHLTGIIEDER